MSTHCNLTSPPEEHLRCSLCLDLFTEPVTTTCGHSFCRTCLSQRWSDGDCYQCPKCNKRFPVKPEFSTNEVMEEMSVQLKRRKTEALESENAPWQVKCDVCADLRFKASKSCLVCLASYCDGHLEPHRRVPALMRHKLVEPLENLEERVCEKHARILEFFCRREQECVCLLCCEAEHRDHETVPVEEEGALQKENLESKRAKIKLMIDERMKKREEFTLSSEMRKVNADKQTEDGEKLFSNLVGRVQEIRSKLQSNIEKKLRKSKEKVKLMIEELEEEVAALQRQHLQLEELLQSEDHFRLLRTLQTLNTMSEMKDWSKTKVYPDVCVQTVRRAMDHLMSSFQTELKTLTTIELTRIRQYKGCMLNQTASPNPMSTPADCCICLDEFTSPASLPCGHRFCLACIGEYWRTGESCQCPLCMAVFPKRPQLKTERTENGAEPLKAGEVPCDVCPARRAAVRSCLVCLASYCSAHLEPHYQREDLGRHLLVSVAKNLEDSVCRLHGRKLDKFCRSDRSCICATCARTEHRGHHVVSVSKEAARNKTKLKRRRLKLQQDIQEKLSVAEDAERTAGLRGGELPAELWAQARKPVKRLEEEISELQERNAELEQLLQTEDNLRFLQRFLHSCF